MWIYLFLYESTYKPVLPLQSDRILVFSESALEYLIIGAKVDNTKSSCIPNKKE